MEKEQRISKYTPFGDTKGAEKAAQVANKYPC